MILSSQISLVSVRVILISAGPRLKFAFFIFLMEGFEYCLKGKKIFWSFSTGKQASPGPFVPKMGQKRYFFNSLYLRNQTSQKLLITMYRQHFCRRTNASGVQKLYEYVFSFKKRMEVGQISKFYENGNFFMLRGAQHSILRKVQFLFHGMKD